MNAKLRRTSSVVVVLVLVLAGALVQSFGGNAAAQSNSEGTLQGTWRGLINPENWQTRALRPSLSSPVSDARGRSPTRRVKYNTFLPAQRQPAPGAFGPTRAHAAP